MFGKQKKIIDDETEIEDDSIMEKCNQIIKTLKEIKDTLTSIREGEIKELKKELDHRNRFTEQLIMAMLEKQTKPSSAFSEYLAKKSSADGIKSVKEINKTKPNLP